MAQENVDTVLRAVAAWNGDDLEALELTARTTGIEFDQEVGELFEFREGRIARVRDFPTHAEALAAAGLSE